MKRKTAIARSLIHDPKFLVYDEPTSGLDPMTSRFIAEYLGKLKSEGRTIVLSAHNLYQVEAICDRVMILRRGKVVALGTMDELREQFGSITYTIWFFAPDPSLIDRHTGPVPGRMRGVLPAMPGIWPASSGLCRHYGSRWEGRADRVPVPLAGRDAGSGWKIGNRCFFRVSNTKK